MAPQHQQGQGGVRRLRIAANSAKAQSQSHTQSTTICWYAATSLSHIRVPARTSAWVSCAKYEKAFACITPVSLGQSLCIP
eukprot:1159982-Pelagomonas_calceolata.AAC.7